VGPPQTPRPGKGTPRRRQPRRDRSGFEGVGGMGILSKLPFFKWGTIDYQVKFYIKKYVSLLQRGFSNNDAIKWLMEFYLQGESYDRREFMEINYIDFINNIDLLICTIMIYYFHYDDSRHYPIEDVLSDTRHFLLKYKTIYNIP
jgi:hypothetical protein